MSRITPTHDRRSMHVVYRAILLMFGRVGNISTLTPENGAVEPTLGIFLGMFVPNGYMSRVGPLYMLSIRKPSLFLYVRS